MKLLKEFLRQELKLQQYRYINPIVAYFQEKMEVPQEKADDLDSFFINRIYQANTLLVKKYDRNFLILLEICFSTGIALLDDIHDNELTSLWKGISLEEVRNIGCLFLFVLPYKLILKFRKISPNLKLNLIETISKFYIRISAGEYQQVYNRLLSHENISLENVVKVMTLKTGEWNALIAAVAVCYAEKNINNNLYVKFSREIGVLRQMNNDIHDIFIAQKSQDILNGVLNFPVVAYLISLDEKKKVKFLKKFNQDKKTPSVIKKLKEELTNDTLLSDCIFILNLQKYKLHHLLRDLAPRDVLYLKFKGFIDA